MALSFIKKVFTFGKPLEEAKPQEAAPAIEPVKKELPAAADPVLPEEVETAGGPVADVVEPEVVEEAEEPAILPDVAQMSDVGVVPLSLLEAEAEAEVALEAPAEDSSVIPAETPPSVPTGHLPHKGGDQVEDAVPDREEGRVEPTETFPEEILPKEDESLLDAEVAQDLPAQPISPPGGEMPGRAEGGIYGRTPNWTLGHSAASLGASISPAWPCSRRSSQWSVSEQTNMRPPLSSRMTSSRYTSSAPQSAQGLPKRWISKG